EHIANGPRFLVKLSSASNANFLSHSDLHTLHIVAVPDWLKKCISKPEVKQIPHSLFAQIVVDPKNSGFRKGLMECRIQHPGRRQVTTERFFHDDSSTVRAISFLQTLRNNTEQAWRDCKIMRGASGTSEQLSQSGKRGWIVVIAIDVIELRHEFREHGVIQPASLRQNAAASAFMELVKGPSGVCDPNDGNSQGPASDQVVQRREDLLVGEIASNTEEDESVGLDGLRFRRFCQRVFHLDDRFTSHDNISSSV